MMEQVVRMVGTGGVEQLQLHLQPLGKLAPGHVVVRNGAIGVNFIDIYQRTGLYSLALPAILGVEGAGVVEEVAADVKGLAPGDRVAYAGPPVGSYATARQLPAGRVIKLPDGITIRDAAASMLKGLTAHMLLTRVYQLKPGDHVLIHAAAGGLGSMLVRWAKWLGAIVIGTAGSPAKAAQALGFGVDHIIIGRDADVAASVAGITGGRGVDYAIDGIGGDMLLKSMNATRRFGMVASIGQAAGPIPGIAVEDIGSGRSLSLARPSVMAYCADQDTYRKAASELLEMMRQGILAEIGAEYPLHDAARAQADLESGRTTGSLLLMS